MNAQYCHNTDTTMDKVASQRHVLFVTKVAHERQDLVKACLLNLSDDRILKYTRKSIPCMLLLLKGLEQKRCINYHNLLYNMLECTPTLCTASVI